MNYLKTIDKYLVWNNILYPVSVYIQCFCLYSGSTSLKYHYHDIGIYLHPTGKEHSDISRTTKSMSRKCYSSQLERAVIKINWKSLLTTRFENENVTLHLVLLQVRFDQCYSQKKYFHLHFVCQTLQQVLLPISGSSPDI